MAAQTARRSFDDADGEALTLRDQLFSDMGVKYFPEPRVIVVADDHCFAAILTGFAIWLLRAPVRVALRLGFSSSFAEQLGDVRFAAPLTDLPTQATPLIAAARVLTREIDEF